jgi:electron transport complex protein RnfD
MKKFLVSPSPHFHGRENTRRIMRDVIIALLPAVAVSIVYFGISAIKLVVLGVVTCVLTEFIIEKYMLRRKVTVNDLSATVTGILLALNMPASSPWWAIVIGSVVAIGIAKMTFGGIGQNIFNPALVGRVFLLVSFPVVMTNWSVPHSFLGTSLDAVSGATPLVLVKEALDGGQTVPQIFAANPGLSYSQLLFARIGSAGEVSTVALLLGFVYLLARKVIRPYITFSIWGSAILLSGILWLANPAEFTDPLFNLLTGGMMLGSIFMATDYTTSPMNKWGMIIFGTGIGFLTILIRRFGAYPEGVSFAILIMNATVPLLNKWCKPERFAKEAR